VHTRRAVVYIAVIVIVIAICAIAVVSLRDDGSDDGERGAGPAPTGAATSSPPPADERLAGIDTTGKEDVTDALNRVIAKLPDGATLTFPHGAKYRIEGTVAIAKKRGVTVDGNGALTFATERGTPNRSHWLVRDADDIVIKNLVVRGPHASGGTAGDAYVPELEAQHGIRVESVSGLELDHVNVSDVYGDFVYLGRDQVVRDWTENVTIHDSVFQRNGRQGIAITAARDVTIEHNEISDTRRSTIDLEPNVASAGAEDIVIRDNEVGAGRLLFVAIGKSKGSIKNVTIDGNELHRPLSILVEGTPGRRPSDITVTNNRSDTKGQRTQLRFHMVDGLTLRGNVAPIESDEPYRCGGCTAAVDEANDFSVSD
jgi:hypothetical protein